MASLSARIVSADWSSAASEQSGMQSAQERRVSDKTNVTSKAAAWLFGALVGWLLVEIAIAVAVSLVAFEVEARMFH